MGKWIHQIITINPDKKTGVCINCGPVELDTQQRCKIARAAVRKNEKRYKQKKEIKDNLIRDFGENCLICGSKDNLAIDHHHETKLVRGILCKKCNAGLGFFGENISVLKSAIHYLQSIKLRPEEYYLKTKNPAPN